MESSEVFQESQSHVQRGQCPKQTPRFCGTGLLRCPRPRPAGPALAPDGAGGWVVVSPVSPRHCGLPGLRAQVPPMYCGQHRLPARPGPGC